MRPSATQPGLSVSRNLRDKFLGNKVEGKGKKVEDMISRNYEVSINHSAASSVTVPYSLILFDLIRSSAARVISRLPGGPGSFSVQPAGGAQVAPELALGAVAHQHRAGRGGGVELGKNGFRPQLGLFFGGEGIEVNEVVVTGRQRGACSGWCSLRNSKPGSSATGVSQGAACSCGKQFVEGRAALVPLGLQGGHHGGRQREGFEAVVLDESAGGLGGFQRQQGIQAGAEADFEDAQRLARSGGQRAAAEPARAG